jgi:hypothetical protein
VTGSTIPHPCDIIHSCYLLFYVYNAGLVERWDDFYHFSWACGAVFVLDSTLSHLHTSNPAPFEGCKRYKLGKLLAGLIIVTNRSLAAKLPSMMVSLHANMK